MGRKPKYATEEERITARREYQRLYQRRRRGGPKRQAHAIVHCALKAGYISKPSICECCGGSATRLEAHHSNYSMPLHIKWLCIKCHRKLHTGCLQIKELATEDSLPMLYQHLAETELTIKILQPEYDEASYKMQKLFATKAELEAEIEGIEWDLL